MSYEVTNIIKFRMNSLRGFFDLLAPPFELKGWTAHESHRKKWVNPLSLEYNDLETCEARYAAIVQIPDKDRYSKFQKWALSQLAELFEPEPQTGTAHDDDFLF